MNKHILVVSQYFYPENFRINDICREWIQRDYKVSVLTGIPNYPEGQFYSGYNGIQNRYEKWNGIDIYRIRIIARGKTKVRLFLNYISFVISGFFWAKSTKINADVVFVYEVSPMTQALPGIWYAKRRKIPTILYVTDLWPENVSIMTGIKNKLLLKPIEYMVDYIYTRSRKILTSSRSFIHSISSRGIDINKLEFWPQYAEDLYLHTNVTGRNTPEIPKDDYLNIIFAGNVGYAQGLGILPSVAEILLIQGHKIRFNIVGDGRYKSELISLVTEKKLNDSFNFIAQQPASRIPELMSVCDVALICLVKSEVFSLTIPSKTQTCLASGIPILVSADGEVQDIINDANAGFCSNAGDVIGLASNIEKMMKLSVDEKKLFAQNGIDYYLKNFDKKMLLDKMDVWISEISN